MMTYYVKGKQNEIVTRTLRFPEADNGEYSFNLSCIQVSICPCP